MSAVVEKIFTEPGDFAATNAAEKWCEENGISVGAMSNTDGVQQIDGALIVRQGPQKVISLTCKGCVFLELEDWKDYLENDETDYGTSAVCKSAEKPITAYWNEGNAPPTWCPHSAKDAERLADLEAAKLGRLHKFEAAEGPQS